MKTRISVQERLKDLRVEQGLNLEELAQKTGISKSALGSYENDNSVNPVQILFLLCDFHKKYILCVLKLAAVSASHCTLVIKAILTNLFTKTLYISNIELYLANF